MNILKLGAIQGAQDFFNEVITLARHPIQTADATIKKRNLTVFFGGDVQDYPEEMSSHRDHGRYVEWNLLNMVTLLSLKFPSTTVFVVKPSRMVLKTFSCYDTFVQSDKLGSPSHNEMGTALEHLKRLLLNSLYAVYGNDPLINSGNSSTVNSQEDKLCKKDLEIESVNVIGFSKGCVVLNQLITEVHAITTCPSLQNEHLRQFWSKVRSLYWLDGGHSGGRDTWVTQKAILNTLASFSDLKIYVHVTPYQVRDDRRPWIGKESKIFIDTLRRAKADIHYQLHFEDDEPSLANHFKVLEVF